MKGPQSLYLSTIAHNRLLGYVERALDGTGTLNGLFGFIEDQTMEMLNGNSDVPFRHPANELFLELTMLEQHELRRPITSYAKIWDQFADALPWYADNPTGAHVLALEPLLEFPSLWDASLAVRERPRLDLDANGTSIGAAIEAIRKPHIRPGSGSDSRDAPWSVARPIFGRDRIDFITADRQTPVSVYLDLEAHQVFYGAFGNRFFTRLEHALITMLEDPEAMIDIEHAALFLEFGIEGVDLDELERAAFEVARNYSAHEAHMAWPGVEELKQADLNELAVKQGYASFDDPTLLCRALQYFYLRQRDIERSLGYDTWHITPDVSETTLATLHLGNRLRLIDGTDLRRLPARIASALLERYGITDIVPTRTNAYRIIASSRTRDPDEGDLQRFSNVIDFHLWKIFQAYARHCLGHSADESLRTSHRTLATLAEGDLFPRVSAIEAFTGTRVSKMPDGSWQLLRGRKPYTTLDHSTFLRVGEKLRSMARLRDPITVVGDRDSIFDQPDSTPKAKPFSYPVSPEIIDITRQILESHDEHGAHNTLVSELRKMLAKTAKPRAKAKPAKGRS